MIFVTLGTQDKPFSRILKILDQAINDGIIQDEIIVQAGNTKYISKNMQIIDFITGEDFEKLILDSDMIITHGGVGSILTALNFKKRIIAAPRLTKFHEHGNDHQVEIINEFEKSGYLIALRENDDFSEVYKKALNMSPKVYDSTTYKVIGLIRNFINQS